MPNWCFTEFRVRGAHEELAILKEKLEKWTSQEYYKSDFGKTWLGNILIGCMIDTGLCTEEAAASEYERREQSYRQAKDKKWQTEKAGIKIEIQPDPDWLPGHRGSIISAIEFASPCELRFETETAWSEMPDAFEWVIERLGLSNGIFCWYLARELSCGYYCTNDILGRLFGEEYDFDVTYLLHGKDAGEGKNEEFFSERVNTQMFLNICRNILEEQISDDIPEEELNDLVYRMNSKSWMSEYSYCSVSRLKRKE